MEVRNFGKVARINANLFIVAPSRPMVKSIVLFGAPHRGLEVTAMQSMVYGTPSEDLIRELKMDSPTLERLNDGFRHVYAGINILTIYEMEPSASLRKNEFDTWERTGPPVMMVEKQSAILYWPMETRIGLNQDHSRIARVDRGQNGCYDDICHFLQQSLDTTRKAEGITIINDPVLHPSALPSTSNRTFILGRELSEAIESGNSNTARDLIQSVKKGPFVQLRGKSLHMAIEHCPEIVSTLLDAGVDVSARKGEKGLQAIHIAGRYAENPETVQLLLDAGADVNAKGYDGWRPLHFAAQYNSNPTIIQALIIAGAAVNAANNMRSTPLHFAVRFNNSPTIVQSLMDAGAAINASDIAGYTPLHAATGYNNSSMIVQSLIDAGATFNTPNVNGSTPLHFAAAKNINPKITRVLINAGATVNARDVKRRTPLHLAAAYNTSEGVITALVRDGADINATNVEGESPLTLSALNENSEICRELLMAKAIPDHKDDKGNTALLLAIEHGQVTVVEHLLEYGADTTAKSGNSLALTHLNYAERVPMLTRHNIEVKILAFTCNSLMEELMRHKLRSAFPYKKDYHSFRHLTGSKYHSEQRRTAIPVLTSLTW